MKLLKIEVIMLAVSFFFVLFAQSPPWSKTNSNSSHASENDFEKTKLGDFQNNTDPLDLSYFKALANKDKVILKWIVEGEEENIEYKIYRSENKRDNFVLIGSSESNFHLSSESAREGNGYFKDLAVAPGITYWYKLVCLGKNKKSIACGPISASIPVQRKFPNRVVTTSPKRFRFEPISHEADESVTTLRLDLPYDSQSHYSTKISIYGPEGESVKTIYRGPMEAGSYQLVWNGDTEGGEMVSGGVFFAVFEDDFIKEATKLILIK